MSYDEFLGSLSSLLPPGPSFCFRPITIDDILKHSQALSSQSLSSGPDELPQFAIYNARPSISSFLVSFFNESKLFERIVHSQIMSFIETNHIFHPRQSGFRSLHSSQPALLKLTDDISRGIDHRKLTILVLFDFSKAFDTVSQLILLTKLRRLNLSYSVLTWLFSYLTGRSQAVISDDGFCSNWLPTTAGVPQGSVLGALLFSLFINDIGNGLRYCDHLIFADDTQIYFQCSPSDLYNALALVKQDISVIANYATTSGLSININKSKIMILGSNPYVRGLDFR